MKKQEKVPGKKRDIIDSLINNVAREGFRRTTTAVIAQKAGVGEGTIYRYFKNKDVLIESAAVQAGKELTKIIVKNYNELDPVPKQYKRFCRDFIASGKANPIPHQFIEQFINSPQGISYRKRMISEIISNRYAKPLLYPLNIILINAKEEALTKEYPLQLLAILTIAPLTFVIKNSFHGIIEIDENMIGAIADSCWDAIKR